MAIKADGDCCFHLAGVVGKLCADSHAVTDGYAACSKEDIAEARTRILVNFKKLTQSKQEFFTSSEEQEGHVTTLFGESSSTFVERVSGNAVLEARLGTNTDLAMSAWQENVRVMVVDTHSLSRDTPDGMLHKAVQFAAVAGERDKTRMVCAILHKKHYDLGVLRTNHGVQAVFQVGDEWDTAIHLILRSIRARLPANGQPQKLLGSRWSERKKQSETKACGDTGRRSTRSQDTSHGQVGTPTHASKAKANTACNVSCVRPNTLSSPVTQHTPRTKQHTPHKKHTPHT